jgi:hypothetical protein
LSENEPEDIRVNQWIKIILGMKSSKKQSQKQIELASSRKRNQFFQFPEWFSTDFSVATYRILARCFDRSVSSSISRLRNRAPSPLGGPRRNGFYVDPKNPENGNFDKDKVPTDFDELELPIIFSLAQVEYIAGLSQPSALNFLGTDYASQGYYAAQRLPVYAGGHERQARTFKSCLSSISTKFVHCVISIISPNS